MLGRADSLQLVNQVRLQSDADIVYISQDDTDPSVDYRDVLDVGRVWELEQGSDYRVYRTESYTTTNSDFGHTIAFTVEVLDSAGSLAFDNADTVTLTTEQRELPETLGTAGQVLTVDEDGVFVEWADVADVPTVGSAGQVLTVNSGATDYEWADVAAVGGTPRPGGREYSLTGHTTLNVVGRVGLFAISGTLTLTIIQTPTSPDPDFRDVIGIGDVIELAKTSSNFRLVRIVSVATDSIIGSYRLLQWAVSYAGGSLDIAISDSITLTTAILTKAADDGQVIAWDDSADSYVPVDADLSVSRTATSVTIEYTAGDNAIIPEATSANAGVLAAADKVVIDRLPNALGTARQVLQVNNTATGTGWYDGGVYHELPFVRPVGYTYDVTHRSGSSDPWYSSGNQVRHGSTTVAFCQYTTNPEIDFSDLFVDGEVFELARRSQNDRWRVVRVNGSPSVVADFIGSTSVRIWTYQVEELLASSGGAGAPSNTPYDLHTYKAATNYMEEGDIVTHLGNGAPENLSIGTSGQVLTVTSGVPDWQDAGAVALLIPPSRLLPIPLTFDSSNNPSDLAVAANTIYGQMFPVQPDNNYQYSLIMKRAGSNTSFTLRLSLYIYDIDDDEWKQVHTITDNTHTNFATDEFEFVGSVKFPSSYDNMHLSGYALITVQADAANRLILASRNIHGDYSTNVDVTSGTWTSGVSGTTSYATLSHWSTNSRILQVMTRHNAA